nr:protein S100-A9-like [Anolis sagrei ordinatus]
MSRTKLEQCADDYIDIFQEFARQSKDKETDTLNKTEFKNLIEQQMPCFLKQVRDPQALNQFFAKVDANKDGKIDFVECTKLLSEFLLLCHEKLFQQEGGPHGHPHCH